MRELKKASLYRHYKNRWYYVLSEATDSETRVKSVVYFPLYLDNIMLFTRPLDMFLEKIDEDKINEEIEQKERFLEIDAIDIDEKEKELLLFIANDMLKEIL